MGIYFNFDFKNGKEVEQPERCYLCGKPDVLYAEYYVLDGEVYKLYKNARKIVRGKEIPVGSRVHPVCEACLSLYPTEEDLVEEIIKRRMEERKKEIQVEIEKLEGKIESKKQEIALKEKELEVLKSELEDLFKQLENLKKVLGS
jgi:flagellar motility protein MotE (MotC chaperone)